MSLPTLLASILVASAMMAVEARGLRRAGVSGGAPPFRNVPGVQTLSGRVIVKMKTAATLRREGRSPEEAEAIRGRAREEVLKHSVKRRESRLDMYIVDTDGAEENAFIGTLMSSQAGQSGIERIEPDYLVEPTACPNDSRFQSQWHHDEAHLQSCAAWDIHTGSPEVTVAICDTGLELTHPDLMGNLKEGYNAVDKLWEGQGGNVSAEHPHGTMCAGCAVGNGNNGLGISGVGWSLSHRPMRVTNAASGGAYLSDLTHAAMTAIDVGDKVASVSYSGVASAVVRDAGTYIKSKGGLLVWAAGNDGANLDWGSRDDDDVIVVGASTSADDRASFSAYGNSVDVVAPGASVLTTTLNGGYAYASGTSFATPLTAGLVGLIWSANPSLTPNEVEQILKQGCDDLGEVGVDATFGHGRINSLKALQMATATTPAPTTTPTPAPSTTAATTAPPSPTTAAPTTTTTEAPTSTTGSSPSPSTTTTAPEPTPSPMTTTKAPPSPPPTTTTAPPPPTTTTTATPAPATTSTTMPMTTATLAQTTTLAPTTTLPPTTRTVVPTVAPPSPTTAAPTTTTTLAPTSTSSSTPSPSTTTTAPAPPSPRTTTTAPTSPPASTTTAPQSSPPPTTTTTAPPSPPTTTTTSATPIPATTTTMPGTTATLPPTTTTTPTTVDCSALGSKAACNNALVCTWSGNPQSGSCGPVGGDGTCVLKGGSCVSGDVCCSGSCKGNGTCQ